MAFLFNKFQEAVKNLAKSLTFARDPRKFQFEADINRLFLYTSYNLLGRDAGEADAKEIIEMASKVSLADQQKLVKENMHAQIKSFSMSMDEILLPDSKRTGKHTNCLHNQQLLLVRVALVLLLAGMTNLLNVLAAKWSKQGGGLGVGEVRGRCLEDA